MQTADVFRQSLLFFSSSPRQSMARGKGKTGGRRTGVGGRGGEGGEEGAQANAYSVIPVAVAYIRLFSTGPRFALVGRDGDGSRGGRIERASGPEDGRSRTSRAMFAFFTFTFFTFFLFLFFYFFLLFFFFLAPLAFLPSPEWRPCRRQNTNKQQATWKRVVVWKCRWFVFSLFFFFCLLSAFFFSWVPPSFTYPPFLSSLPLSPPSPPPPPSLSLSLSLNVHAGCLLNFPFLVGVLSIGRQGRKASSSNRARPPPLHITYEPDRPQMRVKKRRTTRTCTVDIPSGRTAAYRLRGNVGESVGSPASRARPDGPAAGTLLSLRT